MSRFLDVLLQQLGPVGKGCCCVALSGGLDSSMLLYGLAQLRLDHPGQSLRAIHINHQLHPGADRWQQHCVDFCRELDVPLESRRVSVRDVDLLGPEGAARRSRYEAFAGILGPGEYLLTAHHRDDQLETVLLRLFRGAGVSGLAGIPACVPFAGGWLLRPLLRLSRKELESEARRAGLSWVEDSSNFDTDLDRNFLRHRILPALGNRWPAIGETVGRAAGHCAEAASLLDELARMDSVGLVEGATVDLAGLRRLEAPRQRNVLRCLARRLGAAPPSEARLKVGIEQLLTARADAQPVMRWSHGQFRRYRDRLYFLDFDPESLRVESPAVYAWDGTDALTMAGARGRLRLAAADHGGIAASQLRRGMEVRFRSGGETILDKDRRHHKRLKKLFQEAGILPWMRAHVPLVYTGGRLLAVGDLWVSGDAAQGADDRRFAIVWDCHAPVN